MKTIWDKYYYDRKIIDEFLDAFEIRIKGYNSPINWKNTLSKILVWDGFNLDLKYDYSNLINQRKSTGFVSCFKYLQRIVEKKNAHQQVKGILLDEFLNCEQVYFLREKDEVDVIIPSIKHAQKFKKKFLVFYQIEKTTTSEISFTLYKLSDYSDDLNKISVRPLSLPSKTSFFILNRFLDALDSIERHLAFYYYLKINNQNLKSIYFVAGENQWTPNLCNEVFKNTNVKTVNFMNGAKYGWPNDADVDFDKWFVWNNKMKEMLHDNALVPLSVMEVVGHPLRKEIEQHVFSYEFEELNEFKSSFPTIIALFTTSLIFENKFSCYQEILDIVISNPTVGLIIKIHPSGLDDALVFFKDFKDQIQFSVQKGVSKNLLFDIIEASSLTISFGSTVSFESIWLGRLNISYEEFDETQLPIDGDLFFHCNKVKDLKSLLFKKLEKF